MSPYTRLTRTALVLVPLLIGLTLEIGAVPGQLSEENSRILLSFQNLLARAIRKNAALRGLKEERTFLSLKKDLAALRFLPTLQTGIVNKSTVGFGREDYYNTHLELRIRQPIFLGGEVRRSVSLNDFQRFQMDSREEELRQDIVLSTFNIVLEYFLLKEKKHLFSSLLKRAEFLQDLGEQEFLMGELTYTQREVLVLKTKEVQLAELRLLGEERELKRKSKSLFGIDITEENYFPLPPPNVREYTGSMDQLLDSMRAASLMNMIRRDGPLYRKTRLSFEMERAQLQSATSLSPPKVYINAGLFASGETVPLDHPGFDLGISMVWDLPYSTVEGNIQIGKSSPLIRERRLSLSTVTAFDPGRILSKRREDSTLSQKLRQLKKMDEETQYHIEELITEWNHRRAEITLTRREADLYLHERDILKRRMEIGEGTKEEYMTAEIQWSRKEIELFSGIKEMLLFEMGFLLLLGKSTTLLLEEIVSAEEIEG